MKHQWQAFQAEVLKNKHSKITWITFIAFSLGPLFGGVFMFMMKENGYASLSGVMKAKVMMLSFSADWNSLLGLLSQVVAVGGIIVFGFVASWLFGREYSDDTAKDLMALPISRIKILNAKFLYYFVWCIALVFWNLLLGLLIGFALQLPGWTLDMFFSHLEVYFVSTLLVILLNTSTTFFAVLGKGYLAPLGIVILALVFAQIIAVLGVGIYFPWSVPGIYSGSAGIELKSQLNVLSFSILFLTGILGYLATVLWWTYSDQTK